MSKDLVEELIQDINDVAESAMAANPIADKSLRLLLYTIIRSVTFPPEPPPTKVDYQIGLAGTFFTEIIAPLIDIIYGQSIGTARERMLKKINEKDNLRFEIDRGIWDVLNGLPYDELLLFFRDWLKKDQPQYVLYVWKEKLKKPTGIAYIHDIKSI